jgi:hypothetical protein
MAGIASRFIEAASPWQNGMDESFNGRFRDGSLKHELRASVLKGPSAMASTPSSVPLP